MSGETLSTSVDVHRRIPTLGKVRREIALDEFVSFENAFYALSLEYFYCSLHSIERLEPNSPFLAQLYNNIGGVLHIQGFLLKAFHAFHKALQLLRQMIPSNEEYLSWCYNNLGMIYQQWKNDDYVLFYRHEALRIKSVRLPQPQDHPSLRNTYNNLGNLSYSLQPFDQAREYYHRAYQIFLKSLTPVHPSMGRIARN